MKIVIDGRLILQSGIGRYISKLVENLLKLDTDNQYLLLVRSEDKPKIDLKASNLTMIDANFRWFSFDEQVKLPLLLNRLQPDLVHFTNFNLPLIWWRPYVVTIHDLTLLDFKNIRGGRLRTLIYNFKMLGMYAVFWHAIRHSKHIITPSRHAKNDIVKRYRVPPGKVSITYEAADSLNTPARLNLTKFGVKKPFLLYVGNSYPNKNLGRLVEAQQLLRTKHSLDCQLVIAGKVDFWQEQLRNRIEAENKQGVIFTGFVTDKELAGLYRAAALYVFPSLAEGFGLPPLEAMQAGLPVASSSASCMPEVLGEAAEYFNPTDSADMARVVANLLNTPKRQKELVELGKKQVQKYSWGKMATQTLAVYDDVLRFIKP